MLRFNYFELIDINKQLIWLNKYWKLTFEYNRRRFEWLIRLLIYQIGWLTYFNGLKIITNAWLFCWFVCLTISEITSRYNLLEITSFFFYYKLQLSIHLKKVCPLSAEVVENFKNYWWNLWNKISTIRTRLWFKIWIDVNGKY